MITARTNNTSSLLLLLLLLLFSISLQTISGIDTHYPTLPKTIAFGSCHKNKHGNPNIWNTIQNLHPDTFFWTGDAIYPPKKNGISTLSSSYHTMLHDPQIGYDAFFPTLPLNIHGTWDDHDYGGNDAGREMPNRAQRRDLFLDFLNVTQTSQRRTRNGVYSSLSFGEDDELLVLFLDTRWHRDKHCIPSVASRIPLGTIVACLTRWFAAGMNWRCGERTVLGEEQWGWLQSELLQRSTSAKVIILISSIQIMTTNPAVESWGHFPEERMKLLQLLSDTDKLTVLLSGDVHHGEILSAVPNQNSKHERTLLEITSSGMTHSCEGPFYGFLCRPLLKLFSKHRYRDCYYTRENFGSVEFDWEDGGGGGGTMMVNVRDMRNGSVVLTTGSLWMNRTERLTEEEVLNVAQVVDGHLIPIVEVVVCGLVFLIGLGVMIRRRMLRGKLHKVD